MSVRPYLTAVGEWMVSGVLQDRHHELCIVRSASTPLILSKCVPEYCSCSIRNEEVKKEPRPTGK